MKLAVSILSSDYDEEETIRRINATSADYLHIDVVDGHFVAAVTPEREFLHTSTKPLDVHLMVSSPFNYISKFACYNTKTIVIQSEIEDDKDALLEYIRSRGIDCGLALNPETPVSKIEEYLSKIDQVLVLTVHPGLGGQKLIEGITDKIDELKNIREKKGYKYRIIVDGGINNENIDKVKGADIVVVGAYICKSEDYQERIDKLGL